MSLVSTVYGNKLLRPVNQAAADVVDRQHDSSTQLPLPPKQPGRIWLRVPFSEKDKAKAQGARWDQERKFWWAKDDGKLRRFMRWLPKGSR